MTESSEISKELTRLYNEHGKLTASLVVDSARNPDSPLHSQITWDKDKAAYEYQLNQARKIIRVYPILVEDNAEPQRVVHVQTSTRGEGEYHPMSVIVETPTWFESVHAEARKRLFSAQESMLELEHAARASDKKDQLETIIDANKKIGSVVEAFNQIGA